MKSRRKRAPLVPATQIISPVFSPAADNDPFDQLFENINPEKMKLPDRDPLSFSSANTTAQSNQSADGFGLFQSFSDEPIQLVKKKPIRSYKSSNAKTKVNRDKKEKENIELAPVLSATLLRELKFSSSHCSSLQHLENTPETLVSPKSNRNSSPNNLVYPSATKNCIRPRTAHTISSPDLFFHTPG